MCTLHILLFMLDCDASDGDGDDGDGGEDRGDGDDYHQCPLSHAWLK